MPWTYIKREHYEDYLNQYNILKQYKEDIILKDFGEVLFLPKLFLYNYKSQYLVKYLGQRVIQPQIIDGIEFNGNLRQEQINAFNAIVESYKRSNRINGIIKLATGTGKTVLGIYLSAITKLKTIIIVDNEDLMNEWEETIYSFTNLTKQNVGIIKGNKIDIINKSIVLASSQTLVSKLKNDFENFFLLFDSAGFALAIFDECHTTSATINSSKINVLLRTDNILGLSATPYHKDLPEILMKNTVGEVIYDMKNKEIIPSFNIVYYQSEITKNKKAFVISKLPDLIQQRSLYNKLITKCEKWSNTTVKLVKHCLNKNHDVIIVCLTKEQVIEISNKLSSNMITHRRYYGDEREIDKINDNCIVVTYKFCGKGFNMPKLTAAIITTPISGKKSTPQLIGRVLRPQDEEREREIFDLYDLSLPYFMAPEFNRKKYIVKNEYPGLEINEINENSLII